MAHSHCTRPGQGQGPGNDGFPVLCCILFTLDRDREPLFSIVPVPVPVPVPFPVPCSVNEPLVALRQLCGKYLSVQKATIKNSFSS